MFEIYVVYSSLTRMISCVSYHLLVVGIEINSHEQSLRPAENILLVINGQLTNFHAVVLRLDLVFCSMNFNPIC